jgi:hypothetical protein
MQVRYQAAPRSDTISYNDHAIIWQAQFNALPIACHHVMNSDDMLSIIGLARILITIMNPLLWNTR